MINTYLTVYNASTPDWADVADISAFLKFTNLTSQTTMDFLVSQGVGIKYVSEMVECRFYSFKFENVVLI